MTKIKKTICNITASLLLAGIMGTGLSTVALAREAVTEKEKVQMGGGYAASNQLDGVGYSAQIYDATTGKNIIDVVSRLNNPIRTLIKNNILSKIFKG